VVRLGSPARYGLAGGSVLGISLLLYVPTLLPDVGTWDTAEFQAIGPVLGIAHPTGYPTYTLLAWLASVLLQPFGNEAYRADLLSALLVGGAAALLAVRAVQATGRWPLGVLAGVALAVTPIAWRLSTRADAHALHVFLAALILVLLAAWQQRARAGSARAGRWLLAAAIVFGLSLGNHALTLLLAPGIAVYVLLVAPRILRQQWRLVLACLAAAGLAAMAVYAYLPVRSSMGPPLDYADPQTWGSFWYLVLGQQFQGSFAACRLIDILATSGTSWCATSARSSSWCPPVPSSARSAIPGSSCSRASGSCVPGSSRWATPMPQSSATTWCPCWPPRCGSRWPLMSPGMPCRRSWAGPPGRSAAARPTRVGQAGGSRQGRGSRQASSGRCSWWPWWPAL
jgi:4-amino-4-deoxy-L-arabinose transferase-like glycosyltransferase